LAASVPGRAEFGDLVRNQLTECRRLGVTFVHGVDVDAALIARERPAQVVIATGAIAARPWWAPGDAAHVVDVRDVLDGSVSPAGSVVVIDELGFHHATSVAELLADRGCAVEVITNGMVVGQDLGITLDMELWWMRAHAKGIVQSTDLVPMGVDGHTLNLLHHPTGRNETRTPDWVVLAVPPAPLDGLFHELKRAHAAVIDGERVGSAI
jgi:2,4-dienoyl-CoA reductase (NADPH2)